MSPLLETGLLPDLAVPPNRVTARVDRRVGLWHAPAVIAENNFVYKSLSNWAFNVAVGCSHACRFCYVPSVATIKQAAKLAECTLEQYLHLWPDKSLGSQALADRMPNPRQYLKRLEHWWHRVSEWPRLSRPERDGPPWWAAGLL